MAEKVNERESADLPIPETMRIAALLAELMPSNGLAAGAKEAVTKLDKSESASRSSIELPPPLPVAKPVPEVVAAMAAPTAVAVVAAPKAVTTAPVTVPASPDATARIKSAATSAMPKAMPTLRPPSKAEFRLEPEPTRPPSKTEIKLEPVAPKPPVAKPVADVHAAPKPTSESEARKSAPAKSEPKKVAESAGKDDDLIPLGDLSVGGYFSLVNWRNERDKAKHPRRSDYGLDEQTLALARRNPFYLIGHPRRPEARSVANVLSEIVWD